MAGVLRFSENGLWKSFRCPNKIVIPQAAFRRGSSHWSDFCTHALGPTARLSAPHLRHIHDGDILDAVFGQFNEMGVMSE